MVAAYHGHLIDPDWFKSWEGNEKLDPSMPAVPNHSRRFDAPGAGAHLSELLDEESDRLSTPTENMRSSGEEVLGFWVDDMAKTITFADGVPLTVGRLDDRWITAAQGDMSYEFDRQSGILTFAASTTKDGITTLIVGSGQCTPGARQGRSQAIPVQVPMLVQFITLISARIVAREARAATSRSACLIAEDRQNSGEDRPIDEEVRKSHASRA